MRINFRLACVSAVALSSVALADTVTLVGGPTNIAFGNVRIGTISTALTSSATFHTPTVSGNVQTGVAFDGTSTSPFSGLSKSVTSPNLVGSNKTVTSNGYTFAPQTFATTNRTLNMKYTANTATPSIKTNATFSLSGTGVGPQYVTDLGSTDFGVAQVGSPVSFVFNIFNLSPSANGLGNLTSLSLVNISFTGSPAFHTDLIPQVLVKGASVSFQVFFDPTLATLGAQTGQLLIQTDQRAAFGSAKGDGFIYNLQGFGVATPEPSTLAFVGLGLGMALLSRRRKK